MVEPENALARSYTTRKIMGSLAEFSPFKSMNHVHELEYQ